MPLLDHPSASFIVRVWCEPDRLSQPGTPPEWRGSVEHVESSRRAYFRDLAAIAAFIRESLDAPRTDDRASS